MRARGFTVLLTVAIVGATLPARALVAEQWFCERERLSANYASTHPRLDRTELADGRILNVLIPTGYEATDTRYPVLYLLHGGIQSADSWLLHTNVYAFTEDDPFIVVMPEGDLYGSWLDRRDGSDMIESWFTQSLVPFIDAEYRTIADRAHRAIAGFSGGGLGAANIAARNPQMFSTLGVLSGVVDVAGPAGLGIALGAGLASSACGFGTPFGMWGIPGADEVWYRAANPTDLASNLGGRTIYVTAGNGVPCTEGEAQLLTTGDPRWHAEPSVLEQSRRFHEALDRAGIAHTYNEYGCSIHWMGLAARELHAFWPHLVAAIGTEGPDQFDHRRVEPTFSAWDWTFTADPARAPEFLDVADASCGGLDLTGSGLTTVTTAACFEPGDTVLVNGEEVLTADAGRLTFTVDLGPAHEHQQYTPAARALEAAAGYWTSKTVSLTQT